MVAQQLFETPFAASDLPRCSVNDSTLWSGDALTGIQARLAAELTEAAAHEVNWELDNLQTLMRWLSRLVNDDRVAMEMELVAADRSALQTRYVALRERAKAAVVDGALIARVLRKGDSVPHDDEVIRVQERLGRAVDDAIVLARDIRPLLAGLVRCRVRELRRDIDLLRRRVLRELPPSVRNDAEAHAAELDARLGNLVKRGRLQFNIEDGDSLAQTMSLVEEGAAPLRPLCNLARLAEQNSRLFEEPYGEVWTQLGRTIGDMGVCSDPAEVERGVRRQGMREASEARLRYLALTTLDLLTDAIAGGASPEMAAACAAQVRQHWVEQWALLRDSSRRLAPMAVRCAWLEQVDRAFKRAVTIAARCERVQ